MMNQRTCSHRISELYNEIILNNKFKAVYINQESYYLNNLYVTIFKDSGFKTKLLIIEKENQTIIFENLNDESYIVAHDIKEDLFLFLLDVSCSKIYKFYNPLHNKGLLEGSINIIQKFISTSNINDVIVRNDVVYFVVKTIAFRVVGNLITTKELITIDKLPEQSEIEEVDMLIGLDANNLMENGREVFFAMQNSMEFWKIQIPKKNAVILEGFACEYGEYQTYLIDYKSNLKKRIHPSFLTKISLNYMLQFPFIESSHSGHYEEFKLIRLSDLKEIDLYNCLPKDVIEYIDSIKLDAIANDSIHNQFIENDILFFGDYEFSCQNLFSGKITHHIEFKESLSLKSLIPLTGNFFDGYALELHTIKSTLKADGSFETLRTELGELIYKLKYNFDKSSIEPLAQRCANIIKNIFPNIDVIIPAPPSNLNRPFQPVYEIAKRISELTKIPVDFDFIKKLPTEQIKTLSDQEARNIVLERAISIKGSRYKGRNILLFDDLFRSGDTLNAIAKKLRNDGEVNNIKALCVTKTRVKK